MGPKKTKKSGGTKKGRKAEKLRLQQEEEERKRQEEEEAQLQAQEEAARLEKERMLRERMAQLEAKDQERRESELAELSSLEHKFLSAEQWKAESRANAKWEHYLCCDGSPDPAVVQEVNTFISLWCDDPNKDIQLVMEKGEEVLNLIEKLQFLLLDTPPSEMSEKAALQYQECILGLQILLHQKYNGATEELLQNADMYKDSASGNMQAVIKDRNVTFCLWANLTKHMSLPEPQSSENKDLTQLANDKVEESEEEEKKAREEPSMAAEEGECSEGRKSVLSFEENSTAEIKESEEETEKKSEALGMPSEVQDPPMLEERKEEEMVTADEICIVDLQQFFPVGGVYHIDALQLPPQVIKVKGWTMVKVLDDGLEAYPYPPGEAEDATPPPIQITLKLPDHVVYFVDPVVARWDPVGQQWRTDGIRNVVYERQKKRITFQLGTFSAVTLLQDAHLNMPYQAWELRPTGVDEALLAVTTGFATIQIQMKDNQCMLSSVVMEEEDLLSHITGKWLSPVVLRAVLKKAGVNIFPGEVSHSYVSVNKKAALAELGAYQQMALLAPAFAFAWSKWNLEASPEQVVFKVSEHLNPDSAQAWSLYLFNGQRAQKLKITESSEAFSEELEDESEFHSTLYHMLKDFASKEAMEKVERGSFLFIDVVYQLLLATRVLTYS
ncbi:dynein axonemal intermediate chain 7 isoform X4 [Melanerpes formicivorus]|uniref:dynein axonemal intermediate chain 7 isoform X4 n=1 Tax=Melanerpes formicivorus TaxID=211600 RepID=UPI00358FF65C